MILGLFADIHANIHALDACLRHARSHDATRFAFLGDLVGYGAAPGEVLDVISNMPDAVVVQGNHDEAIANPGAKLSESMLDSIEWTRRALSSTHKKYLADLPLTVAENGICFVHSSADAPAAWKYVETSSAARESIDASSATYTFSGHVHAQVLYYKTLAGKTAPFRPISGSAVPIHSHHPWLAIVGSVGQPRDGNPAAAYALFDTEREEITFYRIPYDHLAAAQRIRDAGLPDWLANRIEHGL